QPRDDEFYFRRRNFAFSRLAVSDAICQLRDAGNLLLHHWFFCLWPADVNRHGGGRVFPQRGGRGGDGICRLVCLSWCVACWLATGESTRSEEHTSELQ